MGVGLAESARGITSTNIVNAMATKKASPKKKVAKKPAAKKAVKKAAPKKSSKVCSCHKTCRAEESFWVNYGPVVDSIAALRDAVRTMSDEQFAYHTQRGTNDFAAWVEYSLKNKKVAGLVAKAKTRKAAVQALSTCCK